MQTIYPFILMTISSPYFKSLRASWRRNKKKILDTSEQLRFILEETQTDVYNQFTEKQTEWKPLAEYTLNKKREAKSDLRILHESRGNTRLKDAYLTTGYVEGNKLVYHYPPSKPYAIEHQEGAAIDSPQKAKKKRKKNLVQKRADALDTEYLSRFGFESFRDLF